MDVLQTEIEQRLRELAEQLDCITETDFCVLTGATPKTARSWRKRGSGPEYVLAGNNYFYPKKKLNDWMVSKTHVRRPQATAAL